MHAHRKSAALLHSVTGQHSTVLNYLVLSMVTSPMVKSSESNHSGLEFHSAVLCLWWPTHRSSEYLTFCKALLGPHYQDPSSYGGLFLSRTVTLENRYHSHCFVLVEQTFVMQFPCPCSTLTGCIPAQCRVGHTHHSPFVPRADAVAQAPVNLSHLLARFLDLNCRSLLHKCSHSFVHSALWP